jgi:isoquinoline 1-oxidoreductase subunit beta
MLALKQSQPKPSRRGFLIGAAAAGAGLTVGFHVPLGRRALAAAGAEAPVNPLMAYVRIAPDNTVTVLSAHMDGGQGIYTGLATLVAEELDADWGQMRVEGAWGNPKLYGNMAMGGAFQLTGGSTAIPSSWERYRRAGAVARAMIVEAAAREWGVPAGEVRVAGGVVSHGARAATLGQLADKAASVPPPADVRLKEPSEWRLIGDEKLRRLDSVAKTTGAHPFTIDVYLPGMLTAVIAHPPRFGAKLRSFDAAAAKAVKGVVEVVEVPRGVAVVARDTWAAIKGREALTVEWDDAGAETRGTDALMAEYKALARSGEGAAVARNDGDARGALAGAAKVVEAEFEFPYLAHAAMEPLDAVARMDGDVLEIWAGHQMPDLYQQVAAQTMGIDPSKVRLHVTTPGGFFGRRAVADADVIVEVVSTLKAIGARAPVKVLWTREDDTRGGRYRPMYHHTLRAGLDAQGNLTAWQHRIVGQSIISDTPFAAMVKHGVDETSVEGASTLPYAVPNMHVDLITTKVGVPVLWWRSVGSTHTAYSTEVFLDEVAQAAGKDPVELRRALLKGQDRHLGVLNLAAEKAGWGQPAPEGRYRGIAVHKSFGTYVAQVAEVSLRPDGGIKVERVVCAVDCGIAVNPDIIRAQIEGGVGYGLGAVLKGEITLDETGRVVQGNFDGYQVLTIDEMPSVEVHIVPSTESPTGVGEPGVPPIGPAVANAVFAATGKRIRVLPFSRDEGRTA